MNMISEKEFKAITKLLKNAPAYGYSKVFKGKDDTAYVTDTIFMIKYSNISDADRNTIEKNIGWSGSDYAELETKVINIFEGVIDHTKNNIDKMLFTDWFGIDELKNYVELGHERIGFYRAEEDGYVRTEEEKIYCVDARKLIKMCELTESDSCQVVYDGEELNRNATVRFFTPKMAERIGIIAPINTDCLDVYKESMIIKRDSHAKVVTPMFCNFRDVYIIKDARNRYLGKTDIDLQNFSVTSERKKAFKFYDKDDAEYYKMLYGEFIREEEGCVILTERVKF